MKPYPVLKRIRDDLTNRPGTPLHESLVAQAIATYPYHPHQANEAITEIGALLNQAARQLGYKSANDLHRSAGHQTLVDLLNRVLEEQRQ